MPADDLFDVSGLRVLVTGGSRGIGAMIAEGLVRRGAIVTITARDAEACQAQQERLAEWGECHAVPANLAGEQGVAAVVAALEEHGQLDVLVNNAGATWGAEFDSYPMDGFDKVMNLNVRAVFRLTQALLPLLTARATAQRPSRVINIGSVEGIMVSASQNYAYGASKAAVHHLSRQLARDLAARHVLVNSIAPGPFYSKMMAFALDDQEIRAELERSIPVGRIGSDDDMVGAAVYLLSRASAYVTGTTLVVDGGLSGCS
ncbi:SDR family oxidoreductase [Jatrophihabitans sp.]|uniref:SDR family oxidoreductase n=1 Tax=Jatrophihabitans sp. TaxID=1932789 RepID=UPI0030C7344C|nr:short-chain dehydrogenase/reductase [Jatrophihabitans sp.]